MLFFKGLVSPKVLIFFKKKMNSTIYNFILFEEYMLRLVTIIQYIICTRVCVCVCVCVRVCTHTISIMSDSGL